MARLISVSPWRGSTRLHGDNERGGETMTLEFGLCLLTLFFLAGIGTPVAYSIMVASFVYLAVAARASALPARY
jgi:hypothetical protein